MSSSKDLVSMNPLRERGYIANQSHCVREVTCPAIFQRPHLVAKNLGIFNWVEHRLGMSASAVGEEECIQHQYVWATVDNCLYIWELPAFEKGPVLSQLDQLDQAITAVHLLRAKAGAMDGKGGRPHILVVATTVDIILFHVERDAKKRTLLLTPTDFFTSSDHVSMTKIVSSRDGRIFMSGSDGLLYELEYRQTTLRDKYLNGNCGSVTCAKRRVGRYEKLLELLPPFVGALMLGRCDIVDMCYDPEDEAIYLLMMHEATVRRISLRGETELSVSTTGGGRKSSNGGSKSSRSSSANAAPVSVRVPRALYLLDREHPIRRAQPAYKLAVVMQDGDLVYVKLGTSSGGSRVMVVGTAAASTNRQTVATLGVMVALPFNWKHTTVVATTQPADGPLNRLRFITARPCRSTKSTTQTLNHVVASDSFAYSGGGGGGGGGGARHRAGTLLGKVYHIACVGNHDAEVVEQLYWLFKNADRKRAAPRSSSSSGSSSSSSSSSSVGGGAAGAEVSSQWDDVLVLAHIQRCNNGTYTMEYCPDPLLRLSVPEFLVVGEASVQYVAVLRLLDERLGLEERGANSQINDFLRAKILSGAASSSSSSSGGGGSSSSSSSSGGAGDTAGNKLQAVRDYICMLLIGLCCAEDDADFDATRARRRRTWAHLRDLFTHDLFRSEDHFTGSEADKFKRDRSGPFATAVQVFIAQVLYRVSSIPFRYFVDPRVHFAGVNGGSDGGGRGNDDDLDDLDDGDGSGDRARRRVPPRVLDRLVKTLDRLLELLMHPTMLQLKRSPPQPDDFSFREEFPGILNLLL
jgi:hypothetical protein